MEEQPIMAEKKRSEKSDDMKSESFPHVPDYNKHDMDSMTVETDSRDYGYEIALQADGRRFYEKFASLEAKNYPASTGALDVEYETVENPEDWKSESINDPKKETDYKIDTAGK